MQYTPIWAHIPRPSYEWIGDDIDLPTWLAAQHTERNATDEITLAESGEENQGRTRL